MSTLLMTVAVCSVILNVVLVWYVIKILSKLLYTADNLGDLYVVFRAFHDFVSELYEMEMFYGEPILEELIERTKMVRAEIDRFEDVYELTTDVELTGEADGDNPETIEET